jgi:2-aminoadipate transaminase
LLNHERYYSKLGASFKPSILTTVVLGAFEMAKQGKKLISFTGGSYDIPSLPIAEIKKIYEEASLQDWGDMLQYGSTSGMGSLRVELSKFMAQADIKADPSNQIIVTTGSQEAIDLVTRVFIDKSDIVLVGSPTYLAALSCFKQVNPKFVDIPIDINGMDPIILEKKLVQLKNAGKKPKLLYIIPSFQNPDSSMMTAERRKHTLELVEKFDLIVLEDNPYGYICFEGNMPTPLAGMDNSGRIMYTSTFSKIVSPGMRLGWITANSEFISKMVEAKTNVSICNDGLSQYVAAELLKRGDVAKQIPKMIKVYHKKRDLMLEVMEVNFPKKINWAEPKGGLFLWAKFPKSFNTDDALNGAIQKGVSYIPGSVFFTKSVHNYIRLNYSLPSEQEIVEGIQILGKYFKEKIK